MWLGDVNVFQFIATGIERSSGVHGTFTAGHRALIARLWRAHRAFVAHSSRKCADALYKTLCRARPSWSPRHATYSTFGSRGSEVSFSTSSPRFNSDATRCRGTQPTPRP